VAHHVQRWLEFDDTWTAAGVKDELKAARAQLWCMHKDQILGIWITRIYETDSCSVGAVWGCAGDFKEHKDDAIAFFGIIEDWFREKGCRCSEWIGRGGWERVFTDYMKHAVVLRKRL
jgi:hypothetical protein